MFKHNKIAYYYLQASVFGVGGGGYGYLTPPPPPPPLNLNSKKALHSESSGILSIFLIAKGKHFYSFFELTPPPPLEISGHTPDLVSVIPLADRLL